MPSERMRDPAGALPIYTDTIERLLRSEKSLQGGLKKAPLRVRLDYHFRRVEIAKRIILLRYGAGVELGALRDDVVARTALLHDTEAFFDAQADYLQGHHPSALDGTKRDSAGFCAIALLMTTGEGQPDRLDRLLSPALARRSCLIDLLLKAFIPAFEMAKRHQTDKYASVWMLPVLRALAMPADRRSGALAEHMTRWCRIMRPWGWKPDLNPATGGDNLFCDFAFEVALAVCAYDIDDSAFNDHPYYPRDLVDYYRANVRQTRDAWRAHGVGAGVPVLAPPAPGKIDLATSTRKGIARWVELVCDGDSEATAAVLESVGTPRKIDDIGTLMEALADAGQAIHADIKDDDTTLLQAGDLAEERGLGEFDGPAGPPFGPARCSAGLLAFAHWLVPRGYRLFDLDNDDDAWHAVVVKAGYHAEFIALSSSLNIRARKPGATCVTTR